MNDETLGSHKIDVNPEILFADNALVLDNIKAKPTPKNKRVKLQALSDEDFLNLATSKGMVQINPECL
jgi:hypothetical protein